jgi:hypothetical protein
MTDRRMDKRVEVGHGGTYEVMLRCRNREREEDFILNPASRKLGVALEQKLDSSHIGCSEMNRTYKKDKEEGNEPSEGELGFMKSYTT